MNKLITPLNQSKAFERTCQTLGLDVHRFESEDGTCLVQSRKLPVLGNFHLISRGPVANSPEAADRLLHTVRTALRGILVVNAPDDGSKIKGLRIAGSADLAIVDLLEPDAMRAGLQQKWRNQLNKSERSDIRIENHPLDRLRHKWFLDAEAQQQKSRGYRSYPAGFLLAFAHANKGQARVYTASLYGEPVAAMLILHHGQMATYQAGVTTEKGRELCAHNRLLWQVMCDLQSEDVVQLDLGRSDLNAGLRRFKLGCGARVSSSRGSYVFHSWFAPGKKHPPLESVAMS